MKYVTALILVLSISTLATAQFHIGVRAGIQSTSLKPGDIIGVRGADEDLGLKIQNADYGLHAGLYLELALGGIFIRPEATISTQKVDFRLTQVSNIGVLGDLFTERYTTLDVPVQLGFKLGPLYILGGPNARFFVAGDSDLYDLPEYEQQWESISMGYIGGVGLKIGRIGFDVRYEGNLTAFGDHMRFFNQEVHFDDKPSRLFAGLTLEF